jgi:hypothetical protein
MTDAGDRSAVPGDDRATKPFEIAIDVSKTLLTLATAVITLTITFSKDILGSATPDQKHLIAVAWLFFFLSILGGVWLLYAANGSISSATPGSIYNSNTAVPMGVQQVCFVIGLLLTGIFGLLAF